jgi:hypothetical protein
MNGETGRKTARTWQEPNVRSHVTISFGTSGHNTQSRHHRAPVIQSFPSFDEKDRRKALMAAAGIWKDRKDLPDFSAMRREWDRGLDERGRRSRRK